jgi:hypothetical protein
VRECALLHGAPGAERLGEDCAAKRDGVRRQAGDQRAQIHRRERSANEVERLAEGGETARVLPPQIPDDSDQRRAQQRAADQGVTDMPHA